MLIIMIGTALFLGLILRKASKTVMDAVVLIICIATLAGLFTGAISGIGALLIMIMTGVMCSFRKTAQTTIRLR